MIKAILFDLDGVLVDSYLAWFALFNQTLKHFNFPEITEDVFRRHWGQSTEEDVRIFLPGKTLDEVRDYFLVHFVDFVDRVKLDPDALPVLEELSGQGLKLGCITNSHRVIVNAVLHKNDLQRFFKVTITADDMPPKPAPDMLIKACADLMVSPGEAAFVGDTITDVQTAEAAGCIFIGYRLETRNRITRLSEISSLTDDKLGI